MLEASLRWHFDDLNRFLHMAYYNHNQRQLYVLNVAENRILSMVFTSVLLWMTDMRSYHCSRC